MKSRKNERFGWKVVRKDNHRGVMVSVTNPVIYRINKWAIPDSGCGPLAVFETRQAARDFRGDNVRLSIYRCKYVPSEEKYQWDKLETSNLFSCFEHSVLADKVKLLYKA